MTQTRKIIAIILLNIAILISTASFADIEPTSGRYIESNTDMSIKIIGGHLTWERSYRDRQWRFNRSWESLFLTHNVATGSVESIRRADDIYKKLDSAGTTFKFGKRRTIRKQADGTWLWKDRDGNTSSYDANGKTLRMDSKGGAFITLMYNGDNKLSGAKDVNGIQILWIEYDLISGKISKVKDYGNREVFYTWEVVNLSASPNRFKLTNVKDVRGYDWLYAYSGSVARDGRVDVNSRTDPEGRVITVAYSGSGRTNGVTDALGHTTNYQFDYIKARKEFYLKANYPGGRVTETWYERDGEVKRRDINGINITTIIEDLRKDIETDTFGRVTIKEYDEFKNLLKTIYPDGTSTSATYDVGNSNVLTQTDEGGTVTKYQYWPNGRLKKMTEALGTSVERSTEYTYDQFGQMLTKTQVGDAATETAITQYFYDNKGNISKIIDAVLNEIQFTSYDSQGNALIIIDARDNPRTYEYDELGNYISHKNALNEETSYRFDKASNLIETTFPDNNVIKYEYDSQNRLIKSIDELGYFTIKTYDQIGNKIAETDKMGRSTEFKFDLLGRMIKIEDPAGNITKINFPTINDGLNSGNIYQTIRNDYPTYSRYYKYNLRGDIIEEVESYLSNEGQNKQKINKYKFDLKRNRVEIIDSENNSSKLKFNELNNIVQRTNHDLKETNYKFDSRGNLIELRNPLNHSTSYSFTKINQKKGEIMPMGQEQTFKYDPNGNLIELIDSKSQKTVNGYDLANRKIEVKYYNSNQTLEKTIDYNYNSRSKLNSYNDGTSQGQYSYDKAMQKTAEEVTYGPNIFNLAYSYHKDGKVATYRGLDSVEYTFYYSELSIINNIIIPNEGNISFSDFNWYSPQVINYPGDIKRLESYNGIQDLEKIELYDSSNQSILNYIYNRSNENNIKEIQTNSGNYSYEYDDEYRITKVNNPDLSVETYTYDSMGNRKKAYYTNQFEWIYNQNNQLVNSGTNQFEYDANGNQIKKLDSNGQLFFEFIYNIENRISEVKNSKGNKLAEYYYDPFGRRLSKTLFYLDQTSTTVYFHYNDSGLSSEKSDNQIVSYLFSPNGYWTTYPILKRASNTYYYYQNNYLGMPQLMHSKSGTIVNKKKYSTFGEVDETIELVIDNLTLPGQYKDRETKLSYNYFRYYDPKIGRYLSPDPVFQNDDKKYQYVSQNPQKYFDPLGLFQIDSSCKHCKFKNKWDQAQKACENASNNMSSGDYGAGKLKDCVRKYCKEATLKCQKGKDGDCKKAQGFTRGYGEFTVCVDNNNTPSDLNETVTHEVCHLCDPDNEFRHGNDPNIEFGPSNLRWKRVGCPL